MFEELRRITAIEEERRRQREEEERKTSLLVEKIGKIIWSVLNDFIEASGKAKEWEIYRGRFDVYWSVMRKDDGAVLLRISFKEGNLICQLPIDRELLPSSLLLDEDDFDDLDKVRQSLAGLIENRWMLYLVKQQFI